MSGFRQDFDWQAGYLRHVKRLLGEALFLEADEFEDQRHATDLLVLHAKDLRIGCRIRRHQYLAGYGDEFTIRSSRESGAETELSKIMRGWGDYLFYGFASQSKPGQLAAARLIDLDQFRRLGVHATEVPNGDGTYFIPIRVIDCPGAVFASWGHKPVVARIAA